MIRVALLLATACAQAPEVYTCRQTNTCDGTSHLDGTWSTCGTDESVREDVKADVAACIKFIADWGHCQSYSCAVTCHPTGEECTP